MRKGKKESCTALLWLLSCAESQKQEGFSVNVPKWALTVFFIIPDKSHFSIVKPFRPVTVCLNV